LHCQKRARRTGPENSGRNIHIWLVKQTLAITDSEALARASCLPAFGLAGREGSEGPARVVEVCGWHLIVEAGDAAVRVDGLGHGWGGGGGGLGGGDGDGDGGGQGDEHGGGDGDGDGGGGSDEGAAVG
jgi:hypothetical protein